MTHEKTDSKVGNQNFTKQAEMQSKAILMKNEFTHKSDFGPLDPVPSLHFINRS